jgi:hypothetical protein
MKSMKRSTRRSATRRAESRKDHANAVRWAGTCGVRDCGVCGVRPYQRVPVGQRPWEDSRVRNERPYGIVRPA